MTNASLQQDLEASSREGQELQRQWEQRQGALLGLQGENAGLGQAAALLRAQHAVMQQRNRRLEQQ